MPCGINPPPRKAADYRRPAARNDWKPNHQSHNKKAALPGFKLSHVKIAEPPPCGFQRFWFW